MGDQESRGKVEKLKGRAKEAVGIISGNRTMEREGARQRARGAVQQGVGTARRKVGKAIEGIASAIKK